MALPVVVMAEMSSVHLGKIFLEGYSSKKGFLWTLPIFMLVRPKEHLSDSSPPTDEAKP